MTDRTATKPINIGGLIIGGGNPIAVQSMTNTDTRDVAGTVRQIKELEEAGCELIRVAVLDMEAAQALRDIRRQINIPLAADIHFDYRLALAALDAGVNKLRLNPGNIGEKDRIMQVVKKAKERGVPIRIGVNGGSLEKRFHGKPVGESMAMSALDHIKILEDLDFGNILVSMKSSSVPETIRAYRIIAESRDYPLHVGITEPGGVFSGGIKSAAGIGAILAMGMGDTIRVSLTGSPADEIRYCKEILKAMELRRFGPEIVSCPTCGRTAIDLIGLAARVEDAVKDKKTPMKISIMGCSVNGPGEAASADVGITGGKGRGAVYRKGIVVATLPEEELFDRIMREIDLYVSEH
ncbi:MAG: flavodoxin-dependent (E)-4-hydroxy-3-methylbut-2-enyl-diphosphate synthase [Clostridiales bacterium]|jgi:(E)-4-hydroxy-3-methylbut-2-enyl-diphosphate synthase|nr:flavodoxin-dependent (E)-4-hydroxy-3-methylbut-2-enyl-diphosphate synthase [Clostridiales bacterium]